MWKTEKNIWFTHWICYSSLSWIGQKLVRFWNVKESCEISLEVKKNLLKVWCTCTIKNVPNCQPNSKAFCLCWLEKDGTPDGKWNLVAILWMSLSSSRGRIHDRIKMICVLFLDLDPDFMYFFIVAHYRHASAYTCWPILYFWQYSSSEKKLFIE